MSDNYHNDLFQDALHFTNPEIERAILGAILLDNSLLEEVRVHLTDGDFAVDEHRHILHAMNRLAERGDGLIPLLLKTELRHMRHEDCLSLVTVISDAAAPLDDLAPYARLLKRLTRERRLWQWLETSQKRLTNGEACDTVIAETAEFLSHFPADEQAATSGFYDSLDNFFAAKLVEPELIIRGLYRCEVGELAAMQGIGSTTLLLNLGLKAAAGEPFLPLTSETVVPRRVVYINGAETGWRWRQQLDAMLQGVEKLETARANFTPIVEAMIDGTELNLHLENHWQSFTSRLQKQTIDLLIIDSLASVFPRLQESDSGHLARQVWQSLKRLAKKLNCAVLVNHQPHTGKHSGRQQAIMASMADAIYCFDKTGSAGQRQRLFRCEKSRGEKPAAAILRLSQEGHWFAVCDSDAPMKLIGMPAVEELVEFVKAQKSAPASAIIRHFVERASPRKLYYLLKDAELLGLLEKNRQNGSWQVCSNGGAVPPKERIVNLFLEDGPIPEDLDPEIKYYVFDKREPKNCRGCGAEGYRWLKCEHCGMPV